MTIIKYYISLFILSLVLYACKQEKTYTFQNQKNNNWNEQKLENAILLIDSLVENNKINSTNELLCYDTLRAIAKAFDLEIAEQNILRRYGAYFLDKGDMNQSTDYLQKSRAISLKNKDTSAYWSTTNNLGLVYYQFNLPEKALTYIQPSFNYFNNNKDYISSSAMALNLSVIHSDLLHPNDAKFYANMALKHKLKIPLKHNSYKLDSLEYAMNLIKILSTSNSDSAIVLFSQYLPSIIIENDLSSKCNSYSLGAFIYANKNSKIAIQFKDSCLKYLSNTTQIPTKKEIYFNLKNYFQNTHQFDFAYAYSLKYEAAKDSIYDENKLKTVNNSEQLYNLLANKENQLLRTQNSEKRNWLTFSILGIMALLSILYLSYKNYKNKQLLSLRLLDTKNNEIEELLKTQELNNLNAMLKGQLEERQRIAKDLHDSIGSTLSTIKLMIGNLPITKNNMETQSLQTANTLIDEACKDVRKIAHNLYLVTHEETNFITEIKKRLKTVALNQAIKTTFIDNQIDLSGYPHIQKDLFLITQELISNTLKYAQATEISIQLNIVSQELSFTYDDNGKGFNTQNLEIAEGMGYKSLDERIKKHQGIWHLDSTLGHGMTLIINIPLT